MMRPASMQLPPSEYVLWMVTTLLKLSVCALAIRRELFKYLPLFTTYLALTTARELLFWWIYHAFGYHSVIAFYAFWISQAILLVGRAAAVAELAWRALREYRGIWALAWRVLCGIALFLLLDAALGTRGSVSRLAAFIVTAERGLELAVVGILVILLGICRYYRIPLGPVQRIVALGLGCYSAIQVLNNSFLREWLTSYFPVWNEVRMVSFQMALMLWLVALRKPVPDTAPAPALLPQKIYDEISPQINYRLRVLNQRLQEILKP